MGKLLDRRQFIRMVLQGKHSERLPRALFGGGLWSYRQTGLNPETLREDPSGFAAILADFFADLDTDIVFAGSGLNSFPAESIGGDLVFREGQAPLLSCPVIQKAEDARYLADVDITGFSNTLALVEMIASLRDRMPDRYLCATSWGPMTWAMVLCEWNLLREKITSDRTFVRELCELGVRLSTAFLGRLIERRLIDGVAIPDGAVTLIPVDLYREVVLPCERQLFDGVRGGGVGCILHQCGDIAPQIDLYPETRADCISLDAGVPIGDAYRLYSDRLVTAGNVDVVNVIFGGDPALVCKAVSACVGQIPDPHLRYILMPSCDVPVETPPRNVREFLSCADRVV